MSPPIRQYGKITEDDQRDHYARDRDRILHSEFFRRLSGVTQVVDPSQGKIFHSRLDHTLKVAQLSQRIAEYLKEHTDLDPNPEVAQTAALSHDLGHPPFGHAAEKKLQSLCKKKNSDDDLNLSFFEGNAQSFRIVTRLDVTRTNGQEPQGLNLTRKSLNGILKYPWTYRGDIPDHVEKDPSKKWGVYDTETNDEILKDTDDDTFSWVREKYEDQGIEYKRSLEAQIMDMADDLAYSLHDFEDFFRAGILPLESLANEETPEFERFVEYVEQEHPDYPRKAIGEIVLNAVRLAGFNEPYRNKKERISKMKRFRSRVIRETIKSIRVTQDEGPDESDDIDLPDDIDMRIEILKEIPWYYVIKRRELGSLQSGYKEIIGTIFERFFEAKDEENYRIFPVYFEEQLKNITRSNVEDKEERLARSCIDAICSFTDQEALNFYHKITGVDPGSITDIY